MFASSDPAHYPNPEKFDPNRFTEEECQKRHKAVYLAFLEGPRVCPGMRFATIQILSALVYILKDFNITISPNHKPLQHDPQTFLWQAKDGILLNFTLRH